jgi:secreted PhoX family phosphatase
MPRSPENGEMIGDVILRRYNRREMMRGTLVLAAIVTLFGPQVLAASKARAVASPDRFQFEEVEAGVDIDHHVADGYKARPLIRWGDKLFPRDPRGGVDALWNPDTSDNGWFACPDNACVDNEGRLWIATDQGDNWARTGRADGLYGLET